MATWLYQFWLFSFKTAKHWGRGPRHWTADNLGFSQSSVPSPGLIGGSPSAVQIAPNPTQLCRWAIHVLQEDYDGFSSPQSEAEANLGAEEHWPASWIQTPFEDVLTNNLETNDFSSLPIDKIPVAVPQIAAAASQSSDEMLIEALGFAIMGRNLLLLSSLVDKINQRNLNISGLYPYHLAVTYLDGSGPCCTILYLLCSRLKGLNNIRDAERNGHGHTILDTLFLTILRSHTSVAPSMIDVAFRKDNRFAGEEVDPCGRWEADSECYKELLGKGQTAVPTTWKHEFCHTSVQAVFHCMYEIEGRTSDFRSPGGLFQRLCAGCGLRMHLPPLHTLVVVSYCLATFGLDGEDLFGAIACLLVMLQSTEFIDPRKKAEISVKELLGVESEAGCSHTYLSPADLAEELSNLAEQALPDNAKIGWSVFCLVLEHVEDAWSSREEAGDDTEFVPANPLQKYQDCDEMCEDTNLTFQHSTTLGHVFAAIQTELLTYRRQQEGDTWTSCNFEMRAVLEYLQGGAELHIPLMTGNMMHDHCRCGKFEGIPFLRKDDVAKFHFSNLEDWKRTSIINDREWRSDIY
jgi:hypothetical protein